MAKYSNKNMEDIDITRAELKEFEEALKKEEFRKLLNSYVEEVTDPKNREIYEKEMTQFEKERGVDITFMHPHPGYVIKTSVDGEQKAFINICSNDKVDKPIACDKFKDGVSGKDWSIPYLLAPPKVDLDKKKQRCVVYDVLFHPLALEYAKSSNEFKNLVDDTAISGIEDSFNAKLDRNNLKFPKMDFKGSKIASVVRKLRKDGQTTNEVTSNFPNCPYPMPTENKSPTVTKPRKCNYAGSKNQSYTTPKHILKQRKGIDYFEFLETKDSKVHAVIPSELVVEIDLPLLSSASDAVLDVSTKRLSLTSDKPVKYKLDISLPYEVDEASGSAKFDKRTKKLLVSLPVVRKHLDLSYHSRDDSGIESDPNHNRSSSDEDLECPVIEVLSSSDKIVDDDHRTSTVRTSDEVCGEFLSQHLHYTFPPFSVYNSKNSISVTINVKNIDPSSVCHQYVLQGSGVHLKFTSLGSGHFPINYTFCIHYPTFIINISTLKVEVWDNNIVINMDLISKDGTIVCSYFVGPQVNALEKRHLVPAKNANFEDDINKVDDIEKEEEDIDNSESSDVIPTEIDSPRLHESISLDEKDDNLFAKDLQKGLDKVDDEFHGVTEDLSNEISSLKVSSPTRDKKNQKVRTSSESNAHPPCLAAFSRRSILKTSRSLSESNTDEFNTWSSLDSSDATEENHIKKTVRFSDVIKKKVYRANSSILGQKHKNEKKSRNRKKVAKRRGTSESETSEVSDFSDFSEMSEASETSELSDVSSDDQPNSHLSAPPQLPCGKKHRRRGSKNSRKNAATAKQNNFILSQD